MAKTKKRTDGEAAPKADALPSPSPRSLAALVGLGALSALWALFLWAELVLARQGGTPFCSLGEGVDCAALWDGSFASTIHSVTRLPVAGWGLVWGVVATALPLLGLYRRAEGELPCWLVSAIRVTAGAGAVSLVSLIAVSVAQSTLCLGCLVTYAIVGLYAVVGLYGWRQLGLPDLGPGLTKAGVFVVAAYLALLYPGMQTPKNPAKAASEALANAVKAGGASHDGHGHGPSATTTTTPPPTTHDLGNGPATGDAERDAKLYDLVRTLPPQLKQGLADSLYMYNTAAEAPREPARAVLGSRDAKVHITEWTDARCGHCAQLHETIKQILPIVPPGSFAIEPRHFPLDGACNSSVQRRSPDGASCLAAAAQICLEGNDKLFELSGKLFENQQSLTPDLVYDLAAPYMPKDQLKACVESPETKKKLDDDIAYALRHELEGTPLVVINGKKGTGFGPFLYSMILTGGVGKHPAFAELPAPNPHAHMH